MWRFVLLLCLPLPLATFPAAGADQCTLVKYATLPVTMVGSLPIVTATINGIEVHLVADSGSFHSLLTQDAANRVGMTGRYLKGALMIQGIGGTEKAHIGIARDFALNGFKDLVLHDYEFAVSDDYIGDGIDGLLGQNMLAFDDVEYDLANGAVNLFHATNCGKASLAYWSGTRPVAELDIQRISKDSPHLRSTVKLNGSAINVTLDTGAGDSYLRLKNAARAGFKVDAPDITPGGSVYGIGYLRQKSWIARFDLLDIGGEQIQHPRLRVGDFSADETDLLLGVDFFLSHRVYVSRANRKLYFTYNGGPVFDLGVHGEVTGNPSREETANAAATEPGSAAGYRLRGAAAAARGDLQGASTDLDEAVRRDPDDAENYYQRGLVRWRSGQADAALADFDRALTLSPANDQATESRGLLRLEQGNVDGAVADFASLAGAAFTSASRSVRMSAGLIDHGHYRQAADVATRWIDAHPKDDHLLAVLAVRCRSGALGGDQLQQALDDCSKVIASEARNTAMLDYRGLIWTRLGDYKRATADYRVSLQIQEHDAAWSLYGLGIAELREGDRNQGMKHIDAATRADSKIAGQYGRIGIAP